MKIDYFKTIREAFSFMWKYKVLWVFGFIIALFSGGSSSSNVDTNSYSESTYENTQIGEEMQRFGESVVEFMSTSTFWIIIGVLVLLGIAFSFLVWYLKNTSEIALLRGLVLDRKGQEKKIKLWYLWKDAREYLLSILLLDMTFVLVNIPFVLMMVSLVLIAMGMSSPIIFMSICCIVPVLTIVVLFEAIARTVGIKLMVLRNYSFLESMKEGVRLFFKYFGDLFIGWLVALLPGCGFSIVMGGLALITVLPLLFVVAGIVFGMESILVGLGLGICGMCLLGTLFAAVQAPYIVFQRTYWNKIFMNVFEREFGKK